MLKKIPDQQHSVLAVRARFHCAPPLLENAQIKYVCSASQSRRPSEDLQVMTTTSCCPVRWPVHHHPGWGLCPVPNVFVTLTWEEQKGADPNCRLKTLFLSFILLFFMANGEY